MEKKQTAVELLKETLDAEMKLGTKMVINWDMYLEIEKEQITDAYWDGGQDVPTQGKQAEQYYNETYGKETDCTTNTDCLG